jgi:hypothetical protein
MTAILVFLAAGTLVTAYAARRLDAWHRRQPRTGGLHVTVTVDVGAVNDWYRRLMAEFDDLAGWIVARMRDKDLEADV